MQIPTQLDVTLETVAVGQRLDSDPRDWNVHLQVAGGCLHGVDPPMTDRARRFYQSAQRLANGTLEPEEQWLIAAGIGLSWLIEDDGAQAIPYFERAVKIGRDNPDVAATINESLYNLACAYSLAGDPTAACDHLENLLTEQPRSERKRTLSEIREDPQLRAVKETACFEKLKSLPKKR